MVKVAFDPENYENVEHDLEYRDESLLNLNGHLEPLEGVSNVSSESNKEPIVEDEIGASIEEAESSHTEKATVSEDPELLEKLPKRNESAGSSQQWGNSSISFDVGLSQLQSTVNSWWESSKNPMKIGTNEFLGFDKLSLNTKGDVGKAAVEPRVALSNSTVASADGNSLDESVDMYRQRVKELGEGILKLSEMKHKGKFLSGS